MRGPASPPEPPPQDGGRTFELRGAAAEIFESRDLIVLAHGPAGTGKTTAWLLKIVQACESVPGVRVLITRATRESLSESILKSLEEDVLPRDHPALTSSRADRSQRVHYKFANGSRIVVAGLDKPGKTFSAEYDLIVCFEATIGIQKDGFLKMLRALRNKGPGGVPRLGYYQLGADCNPDSPSHWLKIMADDGKLTAYASIHQDNPLLWDDQKREWTEFGARYMKGMDQMQGADRLRLKDGLWVAAEGSVFDLNVLLAHRKRHAEPALPAHVGALCMTDGLDGRLRDIELRSRKPDRIEFAPGHGGEWTFWCELEPDERGRMRPPQSTTYVLAADIGFGVGASNSIIAVGDRETREKVAEFASARHGPEEFARLLVQAGLWFGGVRDMGFLIWEANGPGEPLGKIVVGQLHYPWVYRRMRGKSGYDKLEGDALGWWNDEHSRVTLAVGLRDAYAQETFINPSVRAIDETMGWIRYPNSRIGPAKLQYESPDAQKTHGDRTIADMMLVHGMAQAPLMAPKTLKPPTGSVAADLRKMRGVKLPEGW